jgi:hypothetical protein
MAKQTESKAIIQTTLSEDKSVITFKVRDAGELVLDLTRVSAAVKVRALIHGLIQRVSDKAAIPCNTTTGLPATPQAKFEAMQGLVDHFMSGTDEWTPARAESAGRKPKDGLDPLLLAAVCEVTGKDEAAVRAIIAKGAEVKTVKPAQFLSALAGAGKVRAVVERMRAEQAPELDGDELLEGLGE